MRPAITLIIGLMALPAQALRLGEVQVESFLGDPLSAVLVVSEDPAEDPTRIDYFIGRESDYSRLDLNRPDIADDIRLGTPELTEGRWIVPLTSRRSVDDLVLDLVIVATRPGAIESRHYPLLLDFPAAITMPEAESGPEQETATAVRSGPPPATAPTGVDGTRSSPRAGARTLVVERGDTLYAIARRVGEGAPLDRVADAVFQLNPDAFVNGNRNRLLAGARLTLPDGLSAPAGARSVSDSAVSSAPVVPPKRAVESERVRLRAPPSPDEIVDSLANWLASDGPTLSGNRDLVQRDLAFARTEIETFQKRNENLRERITNLEQRVGDMRRLLELRAAMGGSRQRDGQQPVNAADANTDTSGAVAAEVQERAAPPPVGSSGDRDVGTLSGTEPAVEEEQRSRWRWIVVVVAVLAAIALLVFFLRARAARRRPESGREAVSRNYLPENL